MHSGAFDKDCSRSSVIDLPVPDNPRRNFARGLPGSRLRGTALLGGRLGDRALSVALVPKIGAAKERPSIRNDFDFQIDEVVDQMHAEPMEVARRPVENTPASPIQ